MNLFERTTRRVRLTHEGRQLLDRCQMPIESLREIGGSLTGEAGSTIRITAPSLAARTTIGPGLLEFAESNPGIAIDLLTTNLNLDFIRDNIDLAFRLGPVTDDSLIARLLWPVPYTFCAGRGFVGTHALKPPISRETLLELPSIMYGSSWLVEQSRPVVPAKTAHFFGELELVKEAVSRNMGIALLPVDMLTDDIVHLRVDGATPTLRNMYAVYPSKRLLPSRVRMLIDHMAGDT